MTKLVELQGICTTIIDESAQVLSWSWDDYTDAVLAKLEGPAVDAALELLERAFGQQWTTDTIGDSTEAKAIADDAGGLRPGQRLFLSNADTIWLVGAWWPWNNGRTISLRIGLVDRSGADTDSTELRRWFGV